MVFIPHSEVYGVGIEDVLHREPSIAKIRAAIGWEPSLDLDRVLADVIDHTRRAPAVELA
jgi:UDP-glucose 4-epimerase